MEKQTFHQSVRKVLFISQVFALMPVTNIYQKNHAKLKYSWISIPTFYAFIIMILNVSEFCLVLKFIFNNGISFHSTGTISLFSVCLMEHVFFWRLATKWPDIMAQWRQVEQIFLKTPYQLYAKFNMKLNIYFWYSFIMLGALTEHSILVFNSFHKSNLERVQCKLNISYWQGLYVRERPHLPSVVPFHDWLLPILEWINLTLAYPRSFTDTFVIIISIGLATKFRQIYLRIHSVRGRTMPSVFWTETREHYLVMKRLMRMINNEISALILLASANNMYFICFQLFNSFNNIGVDGVAEGGFWYSLVFNILRTVLTMYLATLTDEYTKKIISCIRDIPSRSWCVEMASTVVSYELMVAGIINQGAIKQVTNYCSHYYDEPSETLEQYS